MKILKNLIWCIMLLPVFALAQDNNGNLLQVTEFTVKPKNVARFTEGVKLYKECYLKNNGTEHWKVWQPIQGNVNTFVLAGTMANWAEMDKDDPASQACRSIVTNYILPYTENINNTIARNMPEFSRAQTDDAKVISVTFFKVKNNTTFSDILKDVSAALVTAEGKNERGYWYRIVGGSPDDPDYFVTDPFHSFADFGKPRISPWKVYENVNGKKASDALTARRKEAIEKVWSYLFTLREDLSN